MYASVLLKLSFVYSSGAADLAGMYQRADEGHDTLRPEHNLHHLPSSRRLHGLHAACQVCFIIRQGM